ncbi:MAG: hypothetical protein ACT4P4_23010 [Betaproteobacteria bacterium]
MESEPELLRAELAAAERARSAVAPGRTKDEVRAAIGNGQVIAFDSGYEVWVYRMSPPGGPASGKTELVVLFSPSGTVAKSRVRAPPV